MGANCCLGKRNKDVERSQINQNTTAFTDQINTQSETEQFLFISQIKDQKSRNYAILDKVLYKRSTEHHDQLILLSQIKVNPDNIVTDQDNHKIFLTLQDVTKSPEFPPTRRKLQKNKR